MEMADAGCENFAASVRARVRATLGFRSRQNVKKVGCGKQRCQQGEVFVAVCLVILMVSMPVMVVGDRADRVSSVKMRWHVFFGGATTGSKWTRAVMPEDCFPDRYAEDSSTRTRCCGVKVEKRRSESRRKI